MNVSALDQIIHHWDSLINALDFLRALYMERSGRHRVSLLDLWRIGRMGECLPGFLIFREKEPVSDGALPPFVGALFKVVIGINASIQLQYIEEKLIEGRDDESAIEPASVYEYADARGLLIGPDMVCAGPKNMIIELLKVMIHGKGGGLDDGCLRNLISDTDAFVNYSQSLMNYQIAEFLSETIAYCALMDIISDVRAGSPAWRGQPGLLEELTRELESLASQTVANPFFDMAASSGTGSRIHLARFLCSLMSGDGSDCEGHRLRDLAHEMVSVWEAPPRHVKELLRQFLTRSQRAIDFDQEVLGRLEDVMADSLVLDRIRRRINFTAESALETSLGRRATALTPDIDEIPFESSALLGFFQRVLKIVFRYDEGGVTVGQGNQTMRITW